MTRKALLASMIGLLLGALCGCPPPSDGGGDGNQPTELTASQKAAVELVAEQLAAAAAVFGTCTSLADTQLDLDSIASFVTFGTCPVVTFLASAESVLIQLEFGDEGCSGPATADQTVQGAVSLRVTRGTRAAVVEFDGLVVDGHAISGRIDIAIRKATGGVTLEGSCNITTDEVGTVTGDIALLVTAEGLITITQADVTTDDGSTFFQVALENVGIDPLSNGNFVPEGGTATFDMADAGSTAGTITLVVTFAAQTPVDGTVEVTVGDAQPIEYQLPGIGS